MSGALKRSLSIALDHMIDRDGFVYGPDRRKLPHCVMQSAFGMQYLGVELGGERLQVWMLLSVTFYDSVLILPRDGNFLNWRADNTVVLCSLSGGRITAHNEIHAAWYWYQQHGLACRQIAERSGLIAYGERDFKQLIKDILIAGIR